jgi:uncharacterized protein YgiM (DUF1202 family)
MVLSTSLLAQPAPSPAPAAPLPTAPATPAPTLAPAPAKTNAPAAKAAKKKSAKKSSAKQSAKKVEKKSVAKKPAAKKPEAKQPDAAAELKSTPLVPGPAMVVASNVNVRGQAKLNSEVVTRITKGATVTVLEEIVRNNSGPDEPSTWVKILLPPGAHAWINTLFIDATNKTIRPKKLNLRSGPGENYSVIGLLQRGDAVKELSTKGDWTEIEPPATAYAFVAAPYLKQQAAEVAAAAPTPVPPAAVPTPPTPTPPPAEPPPTPTTVATAATVAAPPTEAPPTPAPTPAPVIPAAPVEIPVVTPPTTPEAAAPIVPDGPPPPRIVQREGIVRGMTSIQAPSRFVLISPENRKAIDYLYTTSTNLDLRKYKGLRIIVTGEEGIDDRWGNTPVLTIQSIHQVGE